MTNSTIAPPQNHRFSLRGVSWLLDTRKDYLTKSLHVYILLCKGLLNQDVGMVKGTTVFQEEIRPGAGFETGHFVKEKLGGLP